MLGALFAARKAGSWSDARVTALAYLLMGGSCLANLAYVAAAGRPALPWAVILPGVFTCGLAMSVPAMTLRILARVPQLSGTAASVLGFMPDADLLAGQRLVRAAGLWPAAAAGAGHAGLRGGQRAGLGLAAPQAAATGQRRARLSGRSCPHARAAYSARRHPFTASRPFQRNSGGVAIWIASSGIHQPIRKINNSHYQIFPFRSLPISPEFVAMSSALPTPAAPPPGAPDPRNSDGLALLCPCPPERQRPGRRRDPIRAGRRGPDACRDRDRRQPGRHHRRHEIHHRVHEHRRGPHAGAARNAAIGQRGDASRSRTKAARHRRDPRVGARHLGNAQRQQPLFVLGARFSIDNFQFDGLSTPILSLWNYGTTDIDARRSTIAWKSCAARPA